ncbi:hypothetical protein KSD_14600 [Ktedonobacter sp. SOSP1-85]|nr:hypothetical protein KSD_14600 [Ktedonobacter sp. SOSP1-85]
MVPPCQRDGVVLYHHQAWLADPYEWVLVRDQACCAHLRYVHLYVRHARGHVRVHGRAQGVL